MDDDDRDDSLALLDMDLPDGYGLGLAAGTLGSVELDWIGRELRTYYDGILREPLPDRLLALVDQSLAQKVFYWRSIQRCVMRW